MNRQEKRLSRCLSLQIYYAWIISETHPKEILNYISDLSSSNEEVFFLDLNNLDDSKLSLTDDITKYAYRLIESTINKCDEVDSCISSKLSNRGAAAASGATRRKHHSSKWSTLGVE